MVGAKLSELELKPPNAPSTLLLRAASSSARDNARRSAGRATPLRENGGQLPSPTSRVFFPQAYFFILRWSNMIMRHNQICGFGGTRSVPTMHPSGTISHQISHPFRMYWFERHCAAPHDRRTPRRYRAATPCATLASRHSMSESEPTGHEESSLVGPLLRTEPYWRSARRKCWAYSSRSSPRTELDERASALATEP